MNDLTPGDLKAHIILRGVSVSSAPDSSRVLGRIFRVSLSEDTCTLTTPNNTLDGKNSLAVINTPIIIHGNCATIEHDSTT